ncbi:MAG: glycosyltransferase [Rhizobiaceae bacterium]
MNASREQRPLSISVVIPHMNQPDFLIRSLRALANQKNTDGLDIEVIVVDNGSRELPEEICDLYDNVLLIQELEPGPGPARNKGVSMSSAPILAFVDADCLADENWLSAIWEAFNDRANIKILGGDVRIAYEDAENLTMLEAYESIYAYRQKEYIEKQGFSGTGNLSMRREIYEEVGPFAGIHVAEDRDWGHRAGEKGHKIHYLPDMIVRHPARKTLSELQTKWDRHVSHDFEEQAVGFFGHLKWVAKTVAVAGSPVFELRRIAKSDRVGGIMERFSAFFVLVHIRLYRGRKMFMMLVKGKSSSNSGSWNRD